MPLKRAKIVYSFLFLAIESLVIQSLSFKSLSVEYERKGYSFICGQIVEKELGSVTYLSQQGSLMDMNMDLQNDKLVAVGSIQKLYLSKKSSKQDHLFEPVIANPFKPNDHFMLQLPLNKN